jgi:hypothetical protein
MMLSACKAVVIGTTTGQVRSLVAMARKCGFTLIEDAGSGVAQPKTPITYMFVHYRVGDAVLESIIRTVRKGDRNTRFSPIIVIANDCDFELILHLVDMGVDDVISLPEKRDMLVQRLASQLWTEHVYVETTDYFGPDRRRLQPPALDEERRSGPAGHAHYHIQRIPDFGTKIVRHQIFSAPHFMPWIRVG